MHIVGRRHAAYALAFVLMACGTAGAQITPEQQSALRANCRSDAMSKCSGMRGQDALACLQKNVSSLSPACKTAVSATLPKPAVAAPAVPPKPATPPPAAAVSPPAQATAAPPPPPPAAAPATQPAANPPAPPKPAAAAKPPAPKIAKPAPPKTAPPKPAAPAPQTASAPPDAAAGPTPAQMSALQFTCKREFGRLCKNVPPGPAAFACLQANEAKLSPNCKTSVAAIADEMPAGAAMPASTLAPPPPKVGKPSVVNAVVMLRACKLDLVRHCHGVKAGDGRELACLAAHESELSPRCRMARKVTEPVR